MARGCYFFTISKDGIISRYSGDEQNIIIPEDVTKIEDYAFSSMPFESAVISGGIKTIGKYAFSRCKSLYSVLIPKTIRKIKFGAFLGCKSLEKIYYGGSRRQWFRIKKSLNWRKGSPAVCVECMDGFVELPHFIIKEGILKRYLGSAYVVHIPKGVTAIADYAFFRSHNFFEAVIIPEGVKSIGTNAFWCCLKFAYIELPSSLEKIESNAFSFCRSLKKIEFMGTRRQWNAVKKGENWCNYVSSKLKVVCSDDKGRWIND